MDCQRKQHEIEKLELAIVRLQAQAFVEQPKESNRLTVQSQLTTFNALD